MWRKNSEPTQECITGSPKRMIQPPGGDGHDLWGAEFKGSPCHQRVLKPPGGGSSDIFGASEPAQNPSRRAPRPQMQSTLFGPSQDAAASPRSKPGNDSYNRLFGPVDPRPPSASKNRLKSNIMLNSEESSLSPAESKSSDTSSSTKSETDSQDGNPVTGEGYAAAVNGEKDSSAPAPAPAPNNPAPVTNGTAHSAPPQRARVPPGGFSSGLW